MKKWQIAQFKKCENPVIVPNKSLEFMCPVSDKISNWQGSNVYNPACIVKEGKIYAIYRADSEHLGGIDCFGNKKVVCRLGLSVSEDGINFKTHEKSIIYPDNDEYKEFEWWGGCGDLHIIEGEDGRYYMNYDAWTGYHNMEKFGIGESPDESWEDVLMSAVSDDLIHWQKCGPALKEKYKKYYNHTRSGVVVCKEKNGRFIANRINGKYYMFMSHNGTLCSSDDLIKWDLLLDKNGTPIEVFRGKDFGDEFDANSKEAGAAAILTDEGIVYFYNALGTVAGEKVWSQGQALISKDDLTTVIDKTKEPILYPEYDWEKKGHSSVPCVVCNSIVKFNGKYSLYYGGCDTVIGMAKEV